MPAVETSTVRTPEELSRVDALILPGGESTTMAKLLTRIELMQPIRDRLAAGMPAYGTCAGMILLSDKIADRPDQPTIGGLHVTVDRNAFGRQVESFEADIPFALPDKPGGAVRGVFIRAPYIQHADDCVEVLARFEDKVVAVRQGNILATAFHPELTDDSGVHRFFVAIAANGREKR
jgi:5'-phosphate synthase pdxT subunit